MTASGNDYSSTVGVVGVLIAITFWGMFMIPNKTKAVQACQVDVMVLQVTPCCRDACANTSGCVCVGGGCVCWLTVCIVGCVVSR